jgi:hypothetical protein
MPTLASQATATARPTTQLFDNPLPEKLRTVVTRRGGAGTVQFTLTDRDGRPLDLTAITGSGAPVDGPPVRIFLGELGGQGSLITLDGAIGDAAAGLVTASITTPSVIAAGVYRADIAPYDGAGYTVASTWTLVIEKEVGESDSGPPSLVEIRLFLRDSSSAESRLLDELAFDDAEIALALRHPIDYYNETNPPLYPHYDTTNFPFRYNWIEATISVLFRIAAEFYRRNDMQYQASGVAVNDLNKAQVYSDEADKRWAQYVAWVRSNKVMRNAEGGFGILPSAYSYLW